MKTAITALFLIAGIVFISIACHRHQDPAASLPGARSSDSPDYLTKTEEDAQKTANQAAAKINKDALEAQEVLQSQKSRAERAEAASHPAPAAPAPSQSQTMIDNARYLVAAKKYQEALQLTDNLARMPLTSDQQTSVNILRAEIQRELPASDSAANQSGS